MTFHKSFKILENVFNKGISVLQRLHEVFLIVTEWQKNIVSVKFSQL